MAPLRAQIMHMTKTLHTTDRVMNYFYGARAVSYTHLDVYKRQVIDNKSKDVTKIIKKAITFVCFTKQDINN